jgi:ferredoxin-NADP reductase
MNFPGKPAQLETEVTQVIHRTRDVKSVRFRKPKGFYYLPGQWAFVTLGREEKITKPLSFSSSPTEDSLEFTKRLTGHDFSNAFAAMKIMDEATIRGPYGNLTLQDDPGKTCMLSGGIGITPLRSMIRYSTDKQLKTDIILLYSNRFEDDIAFKDDLDEMQLKNPNFKAVITITKPSRAWKGLTGRINLEMIKRTVPDYAERIFYSCGPRPMVDAMVGMLTRIGLTGAQLKYEYFSGYEEAQSSGSTN